MEETKSQSGEREGWEKTFIARFGICMEDANGEMNIEDKEANAKMIGFIRDLLSESKKEASKETAELALKGIDILSKQYGTKKEAKEMVEVLKKLVSLVG